MLSLKDSNFTISRDVNRANDHPQRRGDTQPPKQAHRFNPSGNRLKLAESSEVPTAVCDLHNRPAQHTIIFATQDTNPCFGHSARSTTLEHWRSDASGSAASASAVPCNPRLRLGGRQEEPSHNKQATRPRAGRAIGSVLSS